MKTERNQLRTGDFSPGCLEEVQEVKVISVKAWKASSWKDKKFLVKI
jgi:hypothetical protein